MTYLLDTHALVWWLYEPAKLSEQVIDLVSGSDQKIFVSAASAYEVANKYRLGKWDEMKPLATNFQNIAVRQDFKLLEISIGDAAHAALMESKHRDPFDRIISAQSIRNSFIVLTKDRMLKELGAITFW